MGEIRERITKRWRGRGADSLYVTKDAALRQEWDAGNLIPADEVPDGCPYPHRRTGRKEKGDA